MGAKLIYIQMDNDNEAYYTLTCQLFVSLYFQFNLISKSVNHGYNPNNVPSLFAHIVAPPSRLSIL